MVMKKLFTTLFLLCAVFCLGLGLSACNEKEEPHEYPYTITFPDEITVKRDGKILKSGDGIDYSERLEITLNTTEDGDWCFEGFDVSGAYKINGEENIYSPQADVNITLKISHKYLEIYQDTTGEYYFSGVKSNFTGDEVIIPSQTYNNDPITIIYSYALDGSNVKKVVLPETIKEIRYAAFENCKNLQEINIPNTVQYIYGNAFKNCSSLDIEINCSSLINIRESAFENCSKLRKVTFGDKLQKIGDYAFKGCTGLTDFNCETGEETASSYIGKEAFCDCVNLSGTISIPSVTTIKESAFNNCENITKVIIPECVTEIGNSAFYNCSSLQEINIPQAIETLPSQIFYNCTNLTNINLPNDLISIDDYAFYNCENLEELNLPSSLTDIGSYAFYNCEKLLLDVVINKDVENYTFYNCKLLKSVTFGEQAQKVGDYAFYGCTSLETLTITNNVSQIGRYAFANCGNLETIEMGNAIRQISFGAFDGCEKLNDFNFIGSIDDWLKISFAGISSNPASLLGELKINGEVNDLEVVGQYRFYSCAFYNISNLKSLTIPATVTSIGDGAFHNCTGLEKIEYDANITPTKQSDIIFDGAGTSGPGIELIIGSNTFSEYVFSSNNNIKSLLLKDTVQKIEYDSIPFKMHSLTIGAGINEIDEWFYYGNSGNLSEDFDLNYLGEIEDWAKIKFASENSNPISYKGKLKIKGTPVTEITIDFDVSDYAFYQFSDLKNLTINNNTHKIGKKAFFKCTNLRTFYYDTEISESDYDSSYEIFGQIGYRENYTSYMDLTIGPNVRTILDSMFRGIYIRKLVIDDNLVSINNLAFAQASIYSIKFGSGINHIANNAFDSIYSDINDITIKNSYVYQYRYFNATIKIVKVLKTVDDIVHNDVFESEAYTRGEMTIGDVLYSVYVMKKF